MRYFGKIKSEKRRASGSKTRNPQSPDGVLRQNGRAKSDKTRRRFTAKRASKIRQNPTAFYGKIGARKTTKTDGYKRQFSAAESDKKLLQKIDKKLRHNPTFFYGGFRQNKPRIFRQKSGYAGLFHCELSAN